MALIVTNHDECGEAQVLAALDDLGDAVDGDDVVLQIGRIDLQKPTNCQTIAKKLLGHKLELYPRFPRCICERLDAAVVLVSAAVEHHLADSRRLGAFGN